MMILRGGRLMTLAAFLVSMVVSVGVAQQPIDDVAADQFNGEGYYQTGQQVGVSNQVSMDSDAVQADASQAASCGCEGGCNCQGGCGCQDGCGNGCGHRRGLCCCEDDPWLLFPCGIGAGINVRGWVDAGATWNDDNNPSSYNGVNGLNDRQDEFVVNQAYVYMEKAINNCGCGWGIGGRVDLLYGTDSRLVEARGLETNRDLTNKWNGAPRYGLAMPQAYLEVAYNNLSVKLGHFYSIVGYESVMAPNNFFYSHSFAFMNGGPFTHTGALAKYQATDNLAILGGFSRGWNDWEDDDNNRLSGLGGINWDNGCGTSIAMAGIIGQEPTGQGVEPATINDERYRYSVALTHAFTDRFTWTVEHGWGKQANAAGPGAAPVQDAEWYDVTNYFLYRVNCCWTAGVRFEWFRDDDGTRVAGLGDRLGQNSNPASAGGFQGNFYELTVGANWSPNANIIVRPEVRFDWFDSGGLNANLPYGDGTSRDQVTVGIDGIFLF